ncbi:MAG: hypothetical protein ACLTDF_08085 [Coprococcus sp.]
MPDTMDYEYGGETHISAEQVDGILDVRYDNYHDRREHSTQGLGSSSRRTATAAREACRRRRSREGVGLAVCGQVQGAETEGVVIICKGAEKMAINAEDNECAALFNADHKIAYRSN